jgi:hypothetical protein
MICPLLQAVSKRGETPKYLYLRLKLAAASLFHGFGGRSANFNGQTLRKPKFQSFRLPVTLSPKS